MCIRDSGRTAVRFASRRLSLGHVAFRSARAAHRRAPFALLRGAAHIVGRNRAIHGTSGRSDGAARAHDAARPGAGGPHHDTRERRAVGVGAWRQNVSGLRARPHDSRRRRLTGNGFLRPHRRVVLRRRHRVSSRSGASSGARLATGWDWIPTGYCAPQRERDRRIARRLRELEPFRGITGIHGSERGAIGHQEELMRTRLVILVAGAILLSSANAIAVPADSAAVAAAPYMLTEKKVRLKGDDNVVRSGPGSTFALVGVYSKGSEFTVIAKKDEWYNIRLSDTNTGWIHSSLCKEFDDMSDLEFRPNPKMFSRIGSFSFTAFTGGYAFDRKSNSLVLGAVSYTH